MSAEAKLERLEAGLTPVTDGWFVVSVPDAAWITSDALGAACVFEGDERFSELGLTLQVLQPGQANGRYHREDKQEDFLVLAGECLLLIDGETRSLRAWDFVHCPPGTDHIFIGAGDRPCVIFMAGARSAGRSAVVYPRSDLALEHRAGVEVETSSPEDAYAPLPPWRPGPPSDWSGLPWAAPRPG
jgi:uncharacterized cupin superfamily protein